MKQKDRPAYSIIVSGEMNDDAGWDLLQIAQTMLHMPHCRELTLDLCAAVIEEELSIFNTDTLVSVFEEGLLLKDASLIVRFSDESEICLSSDQQPLEPAIAYTNVSLDEAKLYGRAMRWLEQEARLLAN
jgi:hypothetical protein